jgi:PAS domain S-box-containing protein
MPLRPSLPAAASSTLASTGDAVITTDAQARITYLNSVAEPLTGWTAADAMGQPLDSVFRIVDVQTGDTIESPVTRALSEGLSVGPANHTIFTRSGTKRRIDHSAAPIRGVRGEILGCVLIFRDIAARRHMEESLRECEERFRLLVERVTDYAIIMLDPQGHVISWNAGAERINGYRAEEIIGRHFSCFYPKEVISAVAFDDMLASARANGRFENEGWRIRKDGSGFWADAIMTPLHDTQGEPRGFVKITRDLTERRRAAESLRSVVDHVIDGILTINERGIVQSMNPAAETLFGYRSGEIIGQNVKMLMPDPYREEHDRYIGNYLRTGDAKVIGIGREVEGRRKDGSTFPMDLAVSTFELDQRRFFTGIVRDITERKRAEQALKEADRRKDEFLATLSHELRNPLAPIRNAVELLVRKSPVDPVLRWGHEVIDRQVQHMTRLLEDLLDVSRISHNKLELRSERVELASVVQMAVETNRPLIASGGHTLTVTLPPQLIYLDADPVRLAQVFSNVLNNAAKYSDAGGHIRVEGAQEDEWVRVCVTDEGIGIDAEVLPRIFDMFSQAKHGSERAQGGLGIGLSLVRGLVELHGGSVEARSAGRGKGSEFIVRLPRVAKGVRDGSHLPKPSEQSNVKQRRLLIVDDMKDSADSLTQLLASLGHEVHTVYEGEEAIRVAEQFRPDAILLDIGMPRLNGYEVCRQILQQPWSQYTVLIALTGWGQADDRRRSSEAGFHHHLVKPIDFESLMNVLASLPAVEGT